MIFHSYVEFLWENDGKWWSDEPSNFWVPYNFQRNQFGYGSKHWYPTAHPNSSSWMFHPFMFNHIYRILYRFYPSPSHIENMWKRFCPSPHEIFLAPGGPRSSSTASPPLLFRRRLHSGLGPMGCASKITRCTVYHMWSMSKIMYISKCIYKIYIYVCVIHIYIHRR